MKKMRWWEAGMLGAVVLSIATLFKFVQTVAWRETGEARWAQVLGFAAAIAGISFLCGVIGWAGRGLYRRIGMAGDALVGMVIMTVFFLYCMILFEPEMLWSKFRPNGNLMLGLAMVVGLIAGPLFGRDLRKELAQSTAKAKMDGPKKTKECEADWSE
jgi:nitrate reductase gamma subunit